MKLRLELELCFGLFSNLKSVSQPPLAQHNLDNWNEMAPNHQDNELQLIKRGSWQFYDPSSLLPPP